MTTINAHYVRQVFVPDQPVDLAEGEAVELDIRRRAELSGNAGALLSRLPLIQLSPDDAEAINRDAEFDVEES
jgi:predicted DNA-binding antitoxin AbrB/MazE fold protein